MRCVHFCVKATSPSTSVRTPAIHRCPWPSRRAGAAPCLRSSRTRTSSKGLSANATLNPTKARIVPLMFAAMSNDGEFEFEYSDSGYCNGGFHHAINRWKHGHFSRLRVTGRNLADYLRKEAPAEIPRIRFVKIDTEGYDRTVVQSLAGLIATVRPYIKTEIYRHLPTGERISYFDDLRQLGYRVFKCEEYALRGEEARAVGHVSLEALRRLRRAG